MNTHSKITQYLQDAHALEGALRRTLIAHIAVCARDEHRALLQEHLQVTVAQERRIAQRLADRGVAANPAQAVFGAAKGAASLALTLAKGPADALRGPTGDDVTLRNAQDECASEALEIAVYDTLEILAVEAGDGAVAELARRHRAEEQEFLARLQATLPELARNVAQNAKGRRRFPLGTVGAIDGARALVRGVETMLHSGDGPDRPAPPAPARPAAPAQGAGAPPAAPAARPAPKPKPRPRPKAAAKPTPKPASARPAPGDEAPLAQYDDMSPYEIGELLDHLPEAKLDEVERYERGHAGREQVLEAIERQRASAGA